MEQNALRSRRELPLQSRNPAFAVAERNTMSLDALEVELLEPSWHLKIGNTDYAVRVVKYSARVCRTSEELF